MIEVHPTYYPDTREWHWDEFQAPSLAALQRKLGDQVVIRDYYPLSRPIAAAFLERALPLTLQPCTVLRQVRAGAGAGERKVALRRGPRVGQGAKRTDGRPKIRIDRELLTRLWNEGYSLEEIAERIGSTRDSVSATIVDMRKKGCRVPKRQRTHRFMKESNHVE